MNNDIVLRQNDVILGLKDQLKGIPVNITKDENSILVLSPDHLVCGIQVVDESYKVFNVSNEWREKTTYICNSEEDNTWFYYVDSVDEVLSEIKRLVIFEATKESQKTNQDIKSQMDVMGIKLDEVKRIIIGFRYEATKRRQREPEYYKLFFNDEWVGELWDHKAGPVLWTNAVSKEDARQASLLAKGVTTRTPDVLYLKESNVEKGFHYTMLLSSSDKIPHVIQSIIDAYKTKNY
jgi:hypothetical protein